MVEKHDEALLNEPIVTENGDGTGLTREEDAQPNAADNQADQVVSETEDAQDQAGQVDQGEAVDAESGDVDVEARDVDQPASEVDEQYEETMVTLSPGQVVTGKVVQVGADEVMVDVGYKSEGRIPLNEIGLKPGETPGDVLEVGQEIEVQVLRVDDNEGTVTLSKRRVDHRQAWERLERAKESGERIEARISERVKGGLLADVGVRGFIPASHVSRNYVENLDEYVGQTLTLKVMEIDKQKNNVVLSHKEVLEEEYEKAKAQAFETLKEGDVVEGVVKRITDFGAFVDIGGGVEGLLHVSEMAWSRVKHPSDVVSEGQKCQVKVLKVDVEQERISLSLKGTMPDPWDTITERYHVGETVSGEVTRVVDFGAFVKLEDGVEGLIHVSQLADHHVEQPSDVVSPGQQVEVRIVSVDPTKRRIGLSMRSPAERSGGSRSRGRADTREETLTTSGDAPSVTLGEMFEDLGSFFDNNSDN